jgi:aldehyde dehydrogenase (NAD+)
VRFDELVGRINQMTDCGIEAAKREVQLSIERLFFWASFSDKYGGSVQETPIYGATVAIHEPVGIIGIACPDEFPLLGFISLFAPAVVRGNTVVIIPSERYPLAALDLYQIFDTSDLPPGVVNIVTGARDLLTKVWSVNQSLLLFARALSVCLALSLSLSVSLALSRISPSYADQTTNVVVLWRNQTLVQHMDVNAMWYFGSAIGSYHVEYNSSCNVKRTFVSYGKERDWASHEQGQGREFLYHAVQVKNIWITAGV